MLRFHTSKQFAARITLLSRYSSKPSLESLLKQEPATKRAEKVLEWFPGNTMFKKTANLTIGTGLMAGLIANDIYIFNEESLILMSFLLFSRFLYLKAGPPLREYLEAYAEGIRSKFVSSAVQEKEFLKSEIADLEGFRDYVDVAKSFCELKRETILLEAELHEVKQKYELMNSIKMSLNEHVRAANEKRENDRRLAVSNLIQSVMEELKDPKLQDKIIDQCYADACSLATK